MKSFDEVFEFSRMAEGNGTESHALCTATAEELTAFIPHVLSLTPCSVVVEIGTYTGRSASVYLQVQKELDLNIHLVDCLYWNPEHAAKSFWDMVIKEFNDAPFTYHKMISSLAASKWSTPIDFLYIDGEHESPYVEQDFDGWVPFLKPGGVLAAHDSQLPAVSACLDKHARSAGWELLAQAERMTVWKKPQHD